MSAYVFIELPPSLNEWLETPETLFPVRASEAEELQRRESPQPERILFELERFLEENPAKQSRYTKAGGQLAFRTAVELFTNRLKEESLAFYELSLRLNPDDLLVRINYAIALHALCYRDAALAEYYKIIRRTTPRENLRIWILAAEIHLYHKEFEGIVKLLGPLAKELFPEDEEFWELLGNARSVLGIMSEGRIDTLPSSEPAHPSLPPEMKPGQPPGASSSGTRSCSKCGALVSNSAKFCSKCGQVVSPPETQCCSNCGQIRKPGTRFCGKCGAAF